MIFCFVLSFCSILCTCTSCDPSMIRISGWIVLASQLDWACVLQSSTFRIVLKPKNASPWLLVHRLLKQQQLQLHLNLHPTLDNLPGLTRRTDTPNSWRKHYNAIQEPRGRQLRWWSQWCSHSMIQIWLTLLRARWWGRHTEWHE